MPSWLAACAIDGSTTPSTNGLSAPSTTAQAPERSTISTARSEISTTKPYAPWATDSSASCTAAYATTPTTANTPPGRTEPPPRLDDLQPWDVYKCRTSNSVADDGSSSSVFAEFSSKWRTDFSHLRGGS